MRKVLAGFVLGAVLMVGGIIGTPAPASAASAGDEATFVAKINGLRQSKGLGTLSVDGELTGIGRRWSERMMAAGAISHNSAFPSQVTSNWIKLGENVGRGGDVNSLFQAFVNSPAHYKNLVDPAFTHIGVGVVIGANGEMWTSHQFMRLGTAAAAPTAVAPKPAAAPKPAPAPAPRVAAAKAPAPVAAAAPTPPPPPAPPVPTVRITLSLENLRGLAAA